MKLGGCSGESAHFPAMWPGSCDHVNPKNWWGYKMVARNEKSMMKLVKVANFQTYLA